MDQGSKGKWLWLLNHEKYLVLTCKISLSMGNPGLSLTTAVWGFRYIHLLSLWFMGMSLRSFGIEEEQKILGRLSMNLGYTSSALAFALIIELRRGLFLMKSLSHNSRQCGVAILPLCNMKVFALFEGIFELVA